MRSSKSSSRSVRCGGPWASGGARQRKQHRGDVQLVGGTTVHPFPTADDVAATLEDFASAHPGRFPRVSLATRTIEGRAAWTPSFP